MSKNTKLTVQLDLDLVEDARNAVAWLQRNADPAEGRFTLARLVEEAIQERITHYSRTHAGGRAFPDRGNDLAAGRPLK